MQCKLNPVSVTASGVETPSAKLNFPGFQEILDFTSAGGEASVSVAVNGDVDKEYKISIYCPGARDVRLRLNNDTGSNYGYQFLDNAAGSLSAVRGVTTIMANSGDNAEWYLLTPAGLIKTLFDSYLVYTSGTTIGTYDMRGLSYNSTSNITTLYFFPDSLTWDAGTRITVFARRA